MISNLHELRAELSQRCRDLSLRYECQPDGDFNAEIAIVGEGPGQNEVNQGIPFVGGSGNLLWNSLRNHRILRTRCFTTNVSKRQISIVANTRHPVPQDEWIKWKHVLQWELSQLPNLKYVLLLGNAAMLALHGIDGVTNQRGSVLSTTSVEGKHLQTLITYNPAAVIREPKNEIIFHMDIRRFNDVINGDYVPYEIIHHINPSYTDAVEWIEKMKSEPEDVSYDIEVISGETACFGLANSGHEAMCINLRDRYSNRYTIDQEADLLYNLQSLFRSKPIIAQNGNFDAHWGGYKDLLNINISFDTMLAHHTLYPLLPHSLGFLTSQYTTHPFYKDDGKEWKEGGDIDGFWRYNCKDAAITWECARRLKLELETQKLDRFFYDHVMRLDPHLVRSTVDGMLVDVSIKSKIASEIWTDVNKIEEKFHRQVQAKLDLPFYKPNIRSPSQMKSLFIDRLKVKTTTTSVDKTNREKWKDDPRTPQDVKEIILTYDEYQTAAKFASTYAEMRVDDDNRFRPVWKQQGVTKAPGRLSSSGNLWGTASNAQNQPTRAQPFFLSDEGTVVIYIDGSQAEARVVAYLADIEKWKHDFERARLNPGSYDAHCALASSMYKLSYDEVPTVDWVVDEKSGLEIPTIRYKAKRARHGLNYRMQWPRLAETAKLSLYEAKKTFILYHNDNPEIKQWWGDLERIVKTKKELFSPYGRRWKLMQRIDDDALESIVAFVPQSTIGDHVKRCWYMSHEDDGWDYQKARIKLNVHDALIGIAKPSFAKTALRIMKKHMENPIMIENTKKTKVEQCIIPGDVAMSEADELGKHRWSTLKKLKGFV